MAAITESQPCVHDVAGGYVMIGTPEPSPDGGRSLDTCGEGGGNAKGERPEFP
jgi:hypothetical protein